MSIYGFYLYLLIVTIIPCPSVRGKTLPQWNTNDDELSNLDGFNAALTIDSSSPSRSMAPNRDSDEEEENQSIVSASFKLPKINTEGTQCYDVASAKRSTDDDDRAPVIRTQNVIHKRRRSPYGVVYNKGRPIGILEPISQIYEFQNVQMGSKESDKLPEKRELERSRVMGENQDTPSPGNTPQNGYANVLTNFKIGHRLKVNEDTPMTSSTEKKRERTVRKRSVDNEDGETVKRKRDVPNRNLAEIEENLKQIMSQLGLTKEVNVSKRDLKSNKRDTEDEDLESGLNKIGLTKELHTYERNRKSYGKALATSNALHGNEKTAGKGSENIVSPEYVSIEGEPGNKKAKKNKITDYRAEGESYIRKKRQQSKTSDDTTDLMKGLETSGDLTVSGNKSPLASSSIASLDSEGRNKNAKDKDEKRDKLTDEQEYEERLQRNIQTKLMKIKEEVKREITALKDQKTPTVADKQIPTEKTAESKRAVEGVKKQEDKKVTVTRRKRSLLDAETDALNPQLNIEDPLIPHARRRRDVDAKELSGDEMMDVPQDAEHNDDDLKDSRVTWHETNDEDRTTGDVNKRDGQTKSELTKKLNHGQQTEGIHNRAKRKSNSKIDDAEQGFKSDDVGLASRKHTNQNAISEAGFSDVQNQNVARAADVSPTHVLVPRSLEAKGASAASQDQKSTSGKGENKLDNPMAKQNLDKLVAESTSLSESVKNERGVSETPSIEIELHTGKEPIDQKGSTSKREKQKDETKSIDNDKKRDVTNVKQKRSAKRDPHDEENEAPEVNQKTARVIKEDKTKLSSRTNHEGESEEDNPVGDTSDSALSEDNTVHSRSAKPAKVIDKVTDSDSNISIKLVGETGDKGNEDTIRGEASKVSDDKDKVDKVNYNLGSTELQKRSTLEDASLRAKNQQIYNDLKKVALGSKDMTVKLVDVESNGPRETVRAERQSSPELSLEDMQRLDSENISKRKRRQIEGYYGRKKRSDGDDSTNTQFKTYRGDEDEVDDESDEFDDDNFDDRTANLIRKRAASGLDNPDYDESDEDYESPSSENEEPQHLNKRNTYLRNYVANINSDVYDNPNYLFEGNESSRKKRAITNDLVALHSGGPMLKHLAAAKERSMQPIFNSYRKKRLEKLNQKRGKDQTIAGLSESDIFGGLPQSYEGELSRFKRVKRQNPSNVSN